MSIDNLQDHIRKYGEHWRYIWFLEQELEMRKTRQSFIRLSLALNVLLLTALIYVLVRP